MQKPASASPAINKMDEGWSSFIAGTLAWTPNGAQLIERLRVGAMFSPEAAGTLSTSVNSVTRLMWLEVERYIKLNTGAGLTHTNEGQRTKALQGRKAADPRYQIFLLFSWHLLHHQIA